MLKKEQIDAVKTGLDCIWIIYCTKLQRITKRHLAHEKLQQFEPPNLCCEFSALFLGFKTRIQIMYLIEHNSNNLTVFLKP